MEHYIVLIRAKGTSDGFNTELSERLHIDFAKEAYRASNKKNYTEQMVSYLMHRDAIHKFMGFLVWTHAIPDRPSGSSPNHHDGHRSTHLEYCQACTMAETPVQTLIKIHGAVDFVPALQAYLNEYVPKCCVTALVYDFVDVYKQITIEIPSPQRLTDETQRDMIRATPGHRILDTKSLSQTILIVFSSMRTAWQRMLESKDCVRVGESYIRLDMEKGHGDDQVPPAHDNAPVLISWSGTRSAAWILGITLRMSVLCSTYLPGSSVLIPLHILNGSHLSNHRLSHCLCSDSDLWQATPARPTLDGTNSA
ncbi:hypothetical protein JB92DRAFT_3099803 [Gautieria morchelliformis]|nr:hypothetical protein JB92DRAFT_3099803 [Gautieria morchelliformis]